MLFYEKKVSGAVFQKAEIQRCIVHQVRYSTRLVNYKLERNGEGVAKGKCVYSQTNTTSSGLKAGNYRFGFTTFGKAGCEVASVYNASRALHESERLSQTIYYFEAWAIEFAIGWGNLESNPLEIYRYLSRRGFSYSKYTNYSSFKSAVGSKTSCYIIMSRWNSDRTSGLHTFFVKKTAPSTYYGYNWHYYAYTDHRNPPQSSISNFNNGSGFIVGYIVWE